MSGWKDWAIGEVVTEADFQSFVQNQVVQIYDDATDRDNTLGTAVAHGMVAYLKDVDDTQAYDGSAWVSLSGSAGITGVTAGTALTGGGTAGNVTLDVDLTALGKVDEVNGAVTTAATGSNVVRNITLSTATPTGGSDGDVWLVYEV